MGQTGVHVDPCGSKWHQNGLKWVQKRLKWVKMAGYRAVGPHPAPCGQSWEVLTHYEPTFELSRYVGFPLEPVRGLWGM